MKKIALKIWDWFMATSFKTKLFIGLGFVFVFIYLKNIIQARKANNAPIIPTEEFPFGSIIKPKQVIRNDTSGLGGFGVSRDGGLRKHDGIDLVVYKSQPIYAPFNGTITRTFYPYANNTKFRGVELVSAVGEFKMKIMYCTPIDAKVGKYVKLGENIAHAQAISEKYTPLMIDHIHVELYQFGTLIDPTLHIQTVNP